MIVLYKPKLSDLWFKRELLSDEETMSYNARWGGTLDFPEERWEQWHRRWLMCDENVRAYRYLLDADTDEFTGEIAYHKEGKIYLCDVIVHARHRNRGIGTKGLELLCELAEDNGIYELWDEIAADNPSVSLFLNNGFEVVDRDDQIVTVRKDLLLNETMDIEGRTYVLRSRLGKGKGGCSYLAECEGKEYVVKQIHHEPCEYYAFGNKIEAELRDYKRLKDAGIRIPEMIACDEEKERIVKEYIEGDVIFDLIDKGEDISAYLPQIEEMAGLARKAGLNIDYYPTNFVVSNGLLYYVDYECNDFMEEWGFENWGRKQWRKEE